MQKITQQQYVLKKNLRIGDAGQNIHIEREREAQRVSIIKSAIVTKQPTFTKGYKVTLYSD